MSDPLKNIPYEAIYEAHGHKCPMSTLGARLGDYGRRLLGLSIGQMLGRYEIPTCARDGIAHTTGCRQDEGTLEVEDLQRHRLLLWPRAGGEGIVVELSERAMTESRGYRRLDEAGQEVMLERLRQLPDEELMEAARTRAR